MASVTINDKEISEALDQVTSKLLPEAIKRGLEKAALIVEADAKKHVPVKTGNLRNSITHKVDGNEAIIGSNVEYAPYVEAGTGAAVGGRATPWVYFSLRDGEFRRTSGQEATHFLEEAVTNNVSKIERAFERELEK